MLISKLVKKGYDICYDGSPKLSIDREKYNLSDDYILVINGNSSLYRSFRFFLSRKTSKCSAVIYIQHSDINDNQSSSYKVVVRYFLIFILLFFVNKIIRVSPTCFPDFLHRKKINTILNGVELPDSQPRYIDNKKIKLLMVGAVNNNKNQRLAIETLKYNNSYTLTIVGDGAEVNNLKEYSKDIGVHDRVFWVGFTKDIEKYYNDSDFLLMLSFNEALPLVVLEAMSYGLPVISVRVGGVPTIIKDKLNGIIIDDYSSTLLSNRIDSISYDESLYHSLSKNSIISVRNNYSLDVMTEKFIKLVESL
nr:glycosyltransferase family 4 protein [Vibrio fluvialis]